MFYSKNYEARTQNQYLKDRKMLLPLKPMKIGIRSLLLLIACSFGIRTAYGAKSVPTSSDCERLSTKTVTSPDKFWDAVVNEDYCEGSYSFKSPAIFTVTIVSHSNRVKRGDIFSISDEGRPEEPPVVLWITSKELQITTIRSFDIGLQKNKFEKIKILYAYRTPTSVLHNLRP
jgi:hypothetical protein